MGTIDEGLIMHERGMGTDEIINTLKESFKRKPNVEGGLIGYATGGVSNLFRSR
jgi:predicted small secreted protein